LLLLTASGVALLFFDLQNRGRWVLVCNPDSVAMHRGRSLPWPFGHTPVGGEAYRAIPIAADADCRTRELHNEEAAAQSFIDLLLERVRAALESPATADLDRARRHLRQALLLTRIVPARRGEAEHMLADLSYHEGRAGLVRAENALRLALSRFQQAQRLSADRFEDLEDWISHLEEILRSISPSPISAAAGGFAPPPGAPPTTPAGAQASPPPVAPPGLTGSPSDAGVDRDLGAAEDAADGARPLGASGIIM
jgi:hypothetical protein